MIPDRLQYLEHFWNDQKCDTIWILGPRICHQHTSKNTRTIMGTSLKNLICFFLTIWHCEHVGRYLHLTCWNASKFGFLIKYEIMDFVCLNFENGIWEFEFWKHEDSGIEQLKFDFQVRESPALLKIPTPTHAWWSTINQLRIQNE